MPTTYIPVDHHLMRAVPWARLRKDDADNVVGIEATAFKLRTDEEYLSAAWVEYSLGSKAAAIELTVRIFRGSDMKPTAKSGFAVGVVATISDACAARDHGIRVIHEKTDDNAAHVAVRRWPVDDLILFEQMARSSWSELVLNRDVP